MKIIGIETIPVLVPINPARAIKGSSGYHTESPFLLVKVHTDEGITGLGEVSCTPRWSGEDNVTASHFIKSIVAPLLEGREPGQIEQLTSLMNGALPNNAFTKSGIEMALWDIAGKAAGQPLYRLLGGPVREFVPTKFSISGLEPDSSAGIAMWAYEQGFRSMKVKVGIEPIQDIARVAAVREAIGPDVRLGVDANGGWSVPTAVETIRRVEELGVFFAEQPVSPSNVNDLAEVRRHVNIPIMADESVYSPKDASNVIRAAAADILSVYVGKGGIGQARKIAAIAQAAGITCTVGSNLELGVGAAAMIHLAMSTSGIDAETYPCDILTPFYYDESLLMEPLDIGAGYARPPEKPGLGVELDEKVVRKYRVD